MQSTYCIELGLFRGPILMQPCLMHELLIRHCELCCTPLAVICVEEGHVLCHRHTGHSHACKHTNSLCYVDKRQLLRCCDDDPPLRIVQTAKADPILRRLPIWILDMDLCAHQLYLRALLPKAHRSMHTIGCKRVQASLGSEHILYECTSMTPRSYSY